MEKVLIIEKHKEIGKSIETIFSKEGYRAEIVPNDKGALEKIKEQEFDLVLCSHYDYDTQEYPVSYMLLSGYGEIESQSNPVKVKIDDFIKSPEHIDSLLKAIKNGLKDYKNIIQNKKLFQRQKESLFKVLKLLIEAIEERDSYWKGHSTRVTERAISMAKILGLTDDKKQILKWAGYLHDIGSATTKLSLLHKTEKLLEEENEQVKSLPLVAHELLSPMNDLKEVARIIFHKSEKFDGTGYPAGLKGNEIPIESRILNVAETYDSLINRRPYRPGFSHEEALRIIQEGSGNKYDPRIVNTFLETFTDKNINKKISDTEVSGNNQARRLILLGNSYRDMGNYKEALEAYTECLDMENLSVGHMIKALLGISYLHLYEGNYSQAEIMARAAKDKARGMNNVLEGQVNLILGLILGLRRSTMEGEKLLNEAICIFKEGDYKELYLQSKLYLARIYAEIYKKKTWSEENFRNVFRSCLEESKNLLSSGILWKDIIISLPVLLIAFTMQEFKDKVSLLLDKFDNLRKETGRIKWDLPEDVQAAILDWIKTSRHKGIPLAEYFIEEGSAEFKKDLKNILKELTEKEIPPVEKKFPMMIYGLGVPRIFLNNELISDKEWNTKKTKLLFLYLISQWGQKVSEDKIIDMFWPESSIEKARQNLYNSVFHIRKVIVSRIAIPPKKVINIHHSTYEINPSITCWYDVNEFEKLYNSGMTEADRGKTEESIRDFKEAIELYRGRFLENYYEDWVINEGYQLQEKFTYMLKELARFFLEKGGYQTSIAYAQSAVEEDPCDQEAYYLIMQCHYLQGKSEQVVRQYLLCSQTLQDEMNITPSEKLTELYLKARGT
ncbi:MAG: Cyclic di-GMP phosphodiesterase response regulator RpfG [bacterium ADurb.Bin363]|nr:MAG: Cyclic di-GMP phosphodiesterase response regulator RpfG [bacterium ADurb.Bin363]